MRGYYIAAIGAAAIVASYAEAQTPVSVGIAANGTCEFGICPPSTPLPPAGSIKAPFTATVVVNGDSYEIAGIVQEANSGSNILSGGVAYYVRYTGNAEGTATKQTDQIVIDNYRSFVAQGDQVRLGAGGSGDFSDGLPPGTSASRTELSSSIESFTLGPWSPPQHFSGSRQYAAQVSRDTFNDDVKWTTIFGSGTPVGGYILINTTTPPPSIAAPAYMVWDGWIYSAGPEDRYFRTRLTLTGDKSNGARVFGTWHEEALSDPGVAVDYNVSGTVSDELVRLNVESMRGNPSVGWCSKFEDLGFNRMKTGDLEAVINDSTGIMHWVGSRPVAKCKEQDVDLFNLSSPTGPASAEAFAASVEARTRNDKAAELRFLAKAGELGRADAFYIMAGRYDGPLLTGPQHVLATAAYRKASALGYRPAKHWLGCSQPSLLEAMVSAWERSLTLRQLVGIVGLTEGDALKFTYRPYVYRLDVSDNEFSDKEFSCLPFFKVNAELKPDYRDDTSLRTRVEQLIMREGLISQTYTLDQSGPDTYKMGRQLPMSASISSGAKPQPPEFVEEIKDFFEGAGLNKDP
jgi:hypothetical protein